MSNNSTSTKPEKRRITMGVVGSCLALTGLVCGLLWDTIFNSLMDKAMTLRPNSKIFEYWKVPPLDISIDIYLFNWTNSGDFKNLSTKPILQQLGPYRFIETPNKVDIRWHPENATVSYRRKSIFKFDAAGSRGSLSDKIITVNPVAVTAAAKTKYANAVRRGMIDIALKVYSDEISITKTVDELLYAGYDDLLLDVVNAVPTLISDIEVPFDKFGYCYSRNDSAALSGFYNVYTGADDISKIGQMHTWNYKQQSGKYAANCGEIKGSAGEFQPPNLKVNSTAHIFIPDLCRTMPLDYVDTVEVDGLLGYKYVGGLRAVDNGSLYPENKCYCNGNCAPSGLMNISACWFNAPIFMSYPHFYNADPYYQNAVEGLAANRDDHELYVVLEPRTGFPLEVAIRFQVNLLVEPMPYLDLFRKTPLVYFPILYFDEKVRLSNELSSELKLLPMLRLGGKLFSAAILIIGIALIAWFRMQQHFNKNRCIRMQYCVDESNMVKAAHNSAVVVDDDSILRKAKPSPILQSTSFDSGCPNMDAVSLTFQPNSDVEKTSEIQRISCEES